MILSAYITWFFLASFAGWVFESIYSILYSGHWERRGFLFGPICPIYGIAVVTALLVFDYAEQAYGSLSAWAVFAASVVGSAVLEYSISVLLERLFGAVWWDYSNLPFNINGRICLPASLLFGGAGLIVAYYIAPAVQSANASIPQTAFEVFALCAVALLSCDTTVTVLSLTDLMAKIMQIDELANEQADEKVQQAANVLQSVPAQIQAGGKKTVGLVVGGGVEMASRAYDAVAVQRETLSHLASHLTTRQAQILRGMRKFRSAELLRKASLLLEARSRFDAHSHKED